MLRTRITSVAELKQVFVETLLNNTSSVSKVTDNSVLGGIAYGVAKTAQKALKDIALVESHIMIDPAYGPQLDDIADSKGIAPRFSSSQSSTYIRVVGTVGTFYQAGVNTVTGKNGIVFDIESDFTIGAHGFGYIKIRSQLSGSNTNIDSLTLDTVSPVPAGHDFLINEYGAFGGRDEEADDIFKKRIKEGANLAATDTLSRLTQIMNKINPNVLRVFYHGTNSQSQVILAVSTQNGIDLTVSELNDIENRVEQYLAISDLKPFGSTITNIELNNIAYQTIDIVFRVELLPAFNPDDVRRDIQRQFSKIIDYRFWKSSDKVEWEDLLLAVKSTEGVKSVPDTQFVPGSDIMIDQNKLPRIRSFQMLDLAGNIISDVSGVLNPVFYPSNPDSSYQQTILSTI